MSKNNVIERGDEVECVNTGFKGIVTGEGFNLQGIKRFDVQSPVTKKGKMGDSYTIDETSLKVIEKNKVPAKPPVKYDVGLGDEVEDTVSGFKGVITGLTVCQNGCSLVSVQPKVNEKGELPDYKVFDLGRLKAIQKKKVAEGQRKTGGPMEKTQRSSGW